MFPLTQGMEERIELGDALIKACEAGGPARDADLHGWIINAVSWPTSGQYQGGPTGLIYGALGTYFFLREDWEAAYLANIYGGIFETVKTAIYIEKDFAWCWTHQISRVFAGPTDDAFFEWYISRWAKRVRTYESARLHPPPFWEYAVKARYAGAEDYEYLAGMRLKYATGQLARFCGPESPGEPLGADTLWEYALQFILAGSWNEVGCCVALFRGDYGKDRISDPRILASRPLFQALEAWLQGRQEPDGKARQKAMKKALAKFIGHLANTIFSTQYYLINRPPYPKYPTFPVTGMPEPILMYAMAMRLDLGDNSDTMKSFVHHFRPYVEVFPFLQAKLAAFPADSSKPVLRPFEEVVEFYDKRIHSHLWEFYARLKDCPPQQ